MSPCSRDLHDPRPARRFSASYLSLVAGRLLAGRRAAAVEIAPPRNACRASRALANGGSGRLPSFEAEQADVRQTSNDDPLLLIPPACAHPDQRRVSREEAGSCHTAPSSRRFATGPESHSPDAPAADLASCPSLARLLPSLSLVFQATPLASDPPLHTTSPFSSRPTALADDALG